MNSLRVPYWICVRQWDRPWGKQHPNRSPYRIWPMMESWLLRGGDTSNIPLWLDIQWNEEGDYLCCVLANSW